MRKGSSRSSRRKRATFALAAISAGAVVGVGAALAHGGGSVDQKATRGFGGISNVDHLGVPAGRWTFDVLAMDGKVRDLTLVIKSGPCPTGTIWSYTQIKKPTLDTLVTTDVIEADPRTATDDYCSQVAFPGAGNSITVSVTHP